MKAFLIIGLSSLLLGGCTNFRKEKFDWCDYQGRTVTGEWKQLTVKPEGNLVIYEEINARTPVIIVNKQDSSLFVRYGQEENTYKITEVKYDDEEFHFTFSLPEKTGRAKCKLIDTHIAFWKIGKRIPLPTMYTNNPQAYKTERKADRPSAECEAETTDNETPDIGTETASEGETSPHFINDRDWKGIKCKSYQKDDGYTHIQECIFPDADMTQAYDIIKKIDPNLKASLPLENMEYSPTENDCMEVSYTYKTRKDLAIEVNYGGGER